MPRISSSTFTREPSGTNIFEPWMRQARSLTGNSSVSLISPFASFSKTMCTVIILLIDDGGISSSEFLSSSTAPVFTSTM